MRNRMGMGREFDGKGRQLTLKSFLADFEKRNGKFRKAR